MMYNARSTPADLLLVKTLAVGKIYHFRSMLVTLNSCLQKTRKQICGTHEKISNGYDRRLK